MQEAESEAKEGATIHYANTIYPQAHNETALGTPNHKERNVSR